MVCSLEIGACMGCGEGELQRCVCIIGGGWKKRRERMRKGGS